MFASLRLHRVEYSLVFCILLIAGTARFVNLDTLPAGLYPDEATNGADVLATLESGSPQLFYPNNYGREGLFINLQALAVSVFGNEVFALRFFSALFGTLTVLGVYLLGKELFHRTAAGLTAGFLLATSYWAINFSRIGFRAIMVAFLLSFSFYFFFRGLRNQKIRDFLIAGLIFGLGLHTYIAFRVAPLILILLLPALMLSYERFLSRFWKHGLAFLLGAFIAASPMLIHFFVTHPEDFISRSTSISVFSPNVNHGDLAGTITKTLGLSLVKYNFFGDQNWRHNYPPYPLLDPFTGTLFLAGLLTLIVQWWSLLVRRLRHADRDYRLITYTFLLGSFGAMLAPEFLTAEGLPHALRSIGTQVPVFLIASLPVLALWKKIKHESPGLRVAVLGAVMIFFSLGAMINAVKYFSFFAHHSSGRDSFNENYTNMARYLRSLPPDINKYVYANAGGTEIDNGLPVTAQSIFFLTHGKVENLHFLRDNTDALLKRPAVLIFQRDDPKREAAFRNRFPDAQKRDIDLNGPIQAGGAFSVISIPPASSR